MFSSLMPQRKEFFELLAAHSDRVVAGANATLRLMNGLGSGTEDIPVLVAEVNMNEQSADKIKAELITLLHRSFTTPINRDQIHTLTIELDNVLNALQDVANAVGMYNIKESTVESRELAELAADACMRLNRAVISLPRQGSQAGNHRTCARKSTPSNRRPTASSARPSPACSTAIPRSGRRSRCASSTPCRKRCWTVAKTPPRRSKKS